MSEQTKECIEIHSLEELKKLIMEKDDNEILTVTVEVAHIQGLLSRKYSMRRK